MALLSAAGRCSPLLPLVPHPLSDDSLDWMFAPSEDEDKDGEQEMEGEQEEEQEEEWEEEREEEQEEEQEEEREEEQEEEQEQEQDDDTFTDFSNGEPQEAGLEEEGQDLDDFNDAACPSKKRKSFREHGKQRRVKAHVHNDKVSFDLLRQRLLTHSKRLLWAHLPTISHCQKMLVSALGGLSSPTSLTPLLPSSQKWTTTLCANTLPSLKPFHCLSIRKT